MHTENPIIEYFVDEDFVYVRFRNLSRPRLFHELTAFKQRVRGKRWLQEEGYWQIPKIDLQVIALFAYERFGPNTLIPVTRPSIPEQMELPFNDQP